MYLLPHTYANRNNDSDNHRRESTALRCVSRLIVFTLLSDSVALTRGARGCDGGARGVQAQGVQAQALEAQEHK